MLKSALTLIPTLGLALIGSWLLLGGANGDEFAPNGLYSVEGTVIDSPNNGAVLATEVLLSYPPAGGDVLLSNWRWSLVDGLGGFSEAGGTRWSNEAVEVIGTWDGASLAVSAIQPADLEDVGPLEVGVPEGCEAPKATQGQSGQTPLVRSVSVTTGTSTSCAAVVHAVGPAETVDEAVRALRRDGYAEVSVDYLIHPVAS